jgi:hypothetical protein
MQYGRGLNAWTDFIEFRGWCPFKFVKISASKQLTILYHLASIPSVDSGSWLAAILLIGDKFPIAIETN